MDLGGNRAYLANSVQRVSRTTVMRIWPGYEPSEAIKSTAATDVRRQLLGMGPAYGTRLKEEDK